MGFIIAAAVIRPGANPAFRETLSLPPVSPPPPRVLFDRQGQREIDEECKDNLAELPRHASGRAILQNGRLSESRGIKKQRVSPGY